MAISSSSLRSLLRKLDETTDGQEERSVYRFPKIIMKNKLSDRMIKQLLNAVIAKYRNELVSRRSLIVLFGTDKSRYFFQPRPAIVNRLFSTMAAENSNKLKLKTYISIRKSAFTLVTLQSFSISGEISAEKM